MALDVPSYMTHQVQAALDALEKGRLFSCLYNGERRHLEVHAVGISTANNPVMRVYDIHKDEFRLMKLAKVFDFSVSMISSAAPRQGYEKNDAGMRKIFKEL